MVVFSKKNPGLTFSPVVTKMTPGLLKGLPDRLLCTISEQALATGEDMNHVLWARLPDFPATARLRLFALAAIACIAPSASFGQQTSASGFTLEAQKEVVRYVAQLGNLHCKETVTQEKLSPTGHVQITEHSTYDYLVMMDGDGDDFSLNESRLETKAAPHKPLPMLVTNGFSTLLLIFHPYYNGAFDFQPGAEDTIDGVPALTVHFKHIHGSRTLAALALRSREYPLDLEGTAWLDKITGQVLQIDAALEEDMSDVGLRSLKVHVEYRPIHLGVNTGTLTLPVLATVEVTTPRQHWRNSHAFMDYKVFGAEAEQDPNVRVKAENNPEPDPTAPPASNPGTPGLNPKEKR